MPRTAASRLGASARAACSPNGRGASDPPVIVLNRRRSWRRRASALALGFAWAVLPAAVRAQAAGFTEQEIKAVYLFNFANFVTWPAQAFEAPLSPIRYCVFGDSPVGDSLADTLKGEKINGRPLLMLRPAGPPEFKGCHVLFIAASRRDRIGEALRTLDGSPTLSVSDIEGFSRSGGMVTLRVENARIRPVINTSRLQRAGLVASSKLLRLAEVITDR
jgi:hypothetical protein